MEPQQRNVYGQELIKGNNLPELSPREMEVGRMVVRFNQLRAFKLDAVEVQGWLKTLLRVFPDLDCRQLEIAIDSLVVGDIPYDHTIGIRNIVIAIKRVQRNDKGEWELFKPLY